MVSRRLLETLGVGWPLACHHAAPNDPFLQKSDALGTAPGSVSRSSSASSDIGHLVHNCCAALHPFSQQESAFFTPVPIK